MPWHQASPTAKAYYYRSVRSARVGGQPRRQYVGGGLVGEAAATADARRRVEREIQARAWREEQARRDAARALLLQLISLTDLMAEAELLAGGYHRHSRTWRKRRVPKQPPPADRDAGRPGRGPEPPPRAAADPEHQPQAD
jgi:hypothetical protein